MLSLERPVLQLKHPARIKRRWGKIISQLKQSLFWTPSVPPCLAHCGLLVHCGFISAYSLSSHIASPGKAPAPTAREVLSLSRSAANDSKDYFRRPVHSCRCSGVIPRKGSASINYILFGIIVSRLTEPFARPANSSKIRSFAWNKLKRGSLLYSLFRILLLTLT